MVYRLQKSKQCCYTVWRNFDELGTAAEEAKVCTQDGNFYWINTISSGADSVLSQIALGTHTVALLLEDGVRDSKYLYICACGLRNSLTCIR